MHVPSQSVLDRPQPGLSAFGLRLAAEFEARAVLLSRAVMRKTEEVERPGLALAPAGAIVDGVFAELDQSRLSGVQAQAELRQSEMQVFQELFCVFAVLEPEDGVVGVAL
jgi:hypothetical protein